MVTNKKTTYLIKKIILLLILVFFSNIFYLYFKKNEKEAFVYRWDGTHNDIGAVEFLSDPITDTDMGPNNITISAPHGNSGQKITSLTHAVDFALKNNPKSFYSSQGKPKQFPINTIVDTHCTNKKNNGDNNAVACMYKPASVAFGYKILPLTPLTGAGDDIREDSSANIYLDNYDQIDKIIEREKIDKNYISKLNTDSSIYKLRDDNEEKINHRGAVEVAYSRKEELNNTKNKYNIANTRNYSINLQYILLFCVILTSIIVLGLYYMSFISNIALIIYIILVTLVIYFFNIINIIN
tara:strand:+ start:3053 stop:3943 length:891 start_codon:yes stop_codon:yes gene_type:complete